MTIVAQALNALPDRSLEWLKASIATWLKRKDLASIIPDLIALAEADMSEKLRSRQQDVRATLTPTPGDAFVALPADFRAVRSLAIPAGSVPDPEYVAPEVMTDQYQHDAPGCPVVYTIIGRELRFAPAPDAAHSIELVYEACIPPLTEAQPTNWLLERSPNAYLFGALMMAQAYIVNDVRLPMFQQMYADAINSINARDWHTAGALSVRSDVRSV